MCRSIGVRRPHRLSRIGATASTYTTNPPASSAAPQIGFVRHITRLIVAHPSLYPIGAHIPSARPSGHQVNQSTESTSNSHVQPPAPNSALKSDALQAPFSSALCRPTFCPLNPCIRPERVSCFLPAPALDAVHSTIHRLSVRVVESDPIAHLAGVAVLLCFLFCFSP